MTHHVANTCVENGNGSWLPLIEYSIKSGLSLSTIRRKIKSNSLRYKLEKGRYLILFEENQNAEHPMQTNYRTNDSRQTSRPSPMVAQAHEDMHSELESSVKLVTEAFEYSLHEKEARINFLEQQNKQLADEVSELRLLVRILEDKFKVRY